MYRFLRNIHLATGTLTWLFLLMYAMSSIGMAHFQWFSGKPSVSERTLPVTVSSDGNARGLARELMDRYRIEGELRDIRTGPDSMRFRIVRPGTVHEIEYEPGAGQARVRTTKANLMGFLNRMHQAHGVRHEDWLANAWGWSTVLISIALMLLGATGVYLWFKIHSERVVGMVLLAAGLLYSLSLIVMLRTA